MAILRGEEGRSGHCATAKQQTAPWYGAVIDQCSTDAIALVNMDDKVQAACEMHSHCGSI